MKRGIKIVKKIELLLKQLNCRSYLHRFGPKKFKLKHHLVALVLMEAYQLSLRRVESLLTMFGIKVPTYSALCKRRKKIPTVIWSSLIQITSGLQHKNVAIDATGFSRTNPSHHYLRRIYRAGYMKAYAKLSMLFDVDKRKVVAVHVRAKPRHDSKDIAPLLGSYCRMQCLLGDKAYDVEILHKKCYLNGIQTIIPKKVNVRRGYYRKMQMKHFSEEKYHQRSLIESGFSAIKRKYGGYVSGRSLASINSELCCKALAHNLRLKH
jgi:transposase